MTLKTFAAVFITLMILDFFWLGKIATPFYVDELQNIGRIQENTFKPVIWAAAVVYILLALGIVLFVLPRIPANASWWLVGSFGAIYGLIVFGVYDFTNLSILKEWSLKLALADVMWGMVSSGIGTVIGRLVLLKLR